MSVPVLRPYQQKMLDAVTAALGRGVRRQLVRAGTGAGKTVCFAAMLEWPGIKAWLEQFPGNQRRVLVVAHREELLDQAAEKIRRANPHLLVCVEQGERRTSLHADVVVASIQTLAAMKYRRLHRMLRAMQFRIVVVDEAHHAAAATYRTALGHMGILPLTIASEDSDSEAPMWTDVADMEREMKAWDQQAPTDRLLVGFTATPNRSDAIGLSVAFSEIVFSYGLKPAIDDGWLVPPVPWVIETDTNLDGVRTVAGDFNQGQLANAVNTPERNRLAVAGWREHAAGLSTICFTVDVAHAHAMADEFRAQGIAAQAISGETPKDQRRQMLRDYSAGLITVLCNCQVLTEGTDLPRTACVLMCKPTKSATVYEQAVGRGLRLFEGKAECVVLDLVDVARKHSLQSVPILFGMPPGLVTAGESMDDLEDEWEKLREDFPNFDVEGALATERLSLKQLRARATKVDIWKVEPLGDFGTGLTLQWVRTGTDYRISYPWETWHETLSVEQNLLGAWDVVLTEKTTRMAVGGRTEHQASQRTLIQGIDSAGRAGELAEAFIRQQRPSIARFKGSDAKWLGDKATQGQLDYLRKLGVHPPAGLTKGDASRLIDQRRGAKGR